MPAECAARPVALWVAGGEHARAQQTIGDLLLNTAGPVEFFVFTARGDAAGLISDAGRERFTIVPGRYDLDQAFAASICRFRESGFFFVSAGTRLPEFWDLRLEWTAERHDGAGAVSPLVFADPPAGIESGEALDWLCYMHSLMEPRESAPLASCVYVSAAAAASAAERWERDSARGGFESFQDILAGLRFRAILADHVAAGGIESSDAAAHGRILSGILRSERGIVKPSIQMSSLVAPRCLHVLHSWGGGLDHWVVNYCSGDRARRNFVLKSINTVDTLACELWLYREARDEHPIRRFVLDPHINGTALRNPSYSSVLSEIVAEFGIESVIVSSLIGHSLDVLRTGLPTALVCHDYYPFCPALNITFKTLCTSCDSQALRECTEHNPHHRFFRHVPPANWMELRTAFAQTLRERNIPLLAPSPSVVNHYRDLQPELETAFRVVPHGSRKLIRAAAGPQTNGSKRLRVMVLGILSINKGRDLIREIAEELTGFADLFLVGAGPDGRGFAGLTGVTVIERYNRDDLPAMVAEIAPDLALLPSVVPETFSYTLQELFDLGVPALATRLGSFGDRIADGVTGFLCAPDSHEILERVRYLDTHRQELARVREALDRSAHASLEEMIDQYRSILKLPPFSSRAYFARDTRAHFKAARRASCRLAWRARGGRFVEPRDDVVHYSTPASLLRLEVPFTASPQIEVLRVDPADRPGIVMLHEIRLLDRDGETVHRWEVAEVEEAASFSSDLVLIRGPAGETIVCAVDSHPRLLLNVPKSAAEKFGSRGALAIRLSVPSLDESIALLQRERVRDHSGKLQGLLDRLSLKGELTGGGGSAPLLQLQDARKRIADLEASLSWRITKPLRTVVGKVPALVRLVKRSRRLES